MQSTNPANAEPVETHSLDSNVSLHTKLERASSAFNTWKTAPLQHRIKVLSKVAESLEDNLEFHARLITKEMGKPLSQARGEVKKCAGVLRYFASNVERLLQPKEVDLDGSTGYVRYDPLGAIFAVMPWNYPYWQVFRFVAPALAAGNVVLVKHAPNTWGSMKAIEKVFAQAGGPPGLVTGLYVDVPAVETVIAHPAIAAITLTGSERAGASVAAHAGKYLKKCVLELGGSDAAIVLADADVDNAVKGVVAARMGNSGQACCNAKRIIVLRGIAEEFIPRFVEAIRNLRVGDPLDETTEIGPLARADLRDNLLRQVNTTLEMGGTLLTGGVSIEGPGHYVEPGALIDIPAGSPAYCEELFGPIAALFIVEDLDAAVALANQSDYGLCASIWTSEPTSALEVAARLEVGGVFINRVPTSDPRIPFGGVKKSGYGRELGEAGFREFVNIKTVCWSAGD